MSRKLPHNWRDLSSKTLKGYYRFCQHCGESAEGSASRMFRAEPKGWDHELCVAIFQATPEQMEQRQKDLDELRQAKRMGLVL